ncbi:heat shock 70 kDa protein 14 [Pectinophora gossypiella]|uniref:heat shock 70 kDa protein 14 n=1 Tax=Pectinophora gossypiella TaxID=13191 RepID=UPI00214F06CB|nr:heat shock 70 kDa protein 14 [Pectinophora gossypiella]
MMATAYGIHLGNSSASLASYANGAASVIANDAGDRTTPAIIALNGSEWEIGLPAKSGQPNSKSVIKHNKRLMNSDFTEDDLAYVESSSSCRIQNDDKLVYEFETSETTLYSSPDNIATKIYAKLFTIASHAGHNEGDLKLVLAAPLHWTNASRDRMVKCAELAGFDVLQVISEPAAALLAYNIEDTTEDINVLVYRLGGSTCDASIVKVSGGFMSVEKNIFRSDLGGQCLTKDLADYIAQEFKQKWKLDPHESRRAMAKLLHHADNCKNVLSTLNSAHVFIESLLDGVDWSQNVSRARFENIISSKISAYIEPAQKILEGFEGKISKIVLCGGSMKIPKLQSAIANLLPEAEVLSGINPDEVIAMGCAREAGLLLDIPEFSVNDMNTEVEFLGKDIYLKYLDHTVHIFKEGSPPFSQNICNIDAGKEKDISFTLHAEPNGEKFASETFNVESLSNPFTLKATLQQSKILLQVE